MSRIFEALEETRKSVITCRIAARDAPFSFEAALATNTEVKGSWKRILCFGPRNLYG
jgi:hypothetical protein